MGSLTKATTETFGPGGVNSTNIQNDSITNAKIASDAAIANSKLSITFPTISSLSITNGQPAVYDTETVDINGTDFTNGARVDFIHSTTNAVLNLPTVTFVSATQLRVTVPASTLTEGTDYKIRVSNPDGLAATSTGTVLYSQNVTFSTSSGSLGSVLEGESASFSVSASSNSTIAYSVTSGSLPSGFSLNSSTGAITGTAPLVDADTTSTFTITATDAESQTASRSFSITVTNFAIANSLRFNSADSPYLSRTPSTSGDQKKWTFSCWFKKSKNGASQHLWSGGSYSGNDGIAALYIHSGDTIYVYYDTSGTNPVGSVGPTLLRDNSAWYHIVWAVDAANTEHKIWLNGELISTDTSKYPPNFNYGMNRSGTVQRIGGESWGGPSLFMDGYMAEAHHIDGQYLQATDFGETDSTTNNWIPKKYTGTYGTNGFYLDFSNSADLGNDSSGNDNDFTPSNLAATDQVIDTPTNNFATLNPISWASTSNSNVFSEGNLKVTTSSNIYGFATATQALPSSGKFYFEVRSNKNDYGGVAIASETVANFFASDSLLGADVGVSDAYNYVSAGQVRYQGNNDTSPATYDSGDIIGCAIDLDGGTVKFYKNNSLQWTSSSSLNLSNYIPCIATQLSNMTANFGQDSSFAGAETRQNNSDANGFGDFYYTPPSGHLALCTNNLPNPAIADPTEHFNTVLYTANNSSTKSVTGVGFQPDFVWLKNRGLSQSHYIGDSNRGTDVLLQSDTTGADVTAGATNWINYDSDGFTLNTVYGNYQSYNYVGWNWKANAGTTSSNTDGSITSTVQANTTAGFSIVTYTGTGANGTIGHGLGKTPEWIMTKRRDSTGEWMVYQKSFSEDGSGEFNLMNLNDTDTTQEFGAYNFMQSTSPTSSVFYIDGQTEMNASGGTFVAYCFSPIEGYSKFGSYTGNNNADGTFVYTGFKPAWLMVKRTADAARAWVIHDNKQDPDNPTANRLDANTAEGNQSSGHFDFLSNGFKCRSTEGATNAASPYIYMAFAEAPFKSGTGATTIEGTAR